MSTCSRAVGSRSSSVHLRAVAVAALALVAPACSLVVSGDPPVRCVVGSPDPCGQGLRCEDGRCVAGEPPPPPADGGMDAPAEDTGPATHELCNCIDDDGDGLVDEDFDADRDRATLCGCMGQGVDCDDTDPFVHPRVILPPDEFGQDAGILNAATERCDGKDNDCDGVVDEDSCREGEVCRQGTCLAASDCVVTGCPTGQRCESGTCMAGSCGTDADCPTEPNRVCDTTSGRCVPRSMLGDLCEVDAQCGAGGACIPRSALGLSSGGSKVCTIACCSDLDCGPVGGDQICYHASTGVRTCANRTLLGPSYPVPGSTLGLMSCAAPEDCRSAMCADALGGAVCVSPCVERCGTNEVCNFAPELPGVGQAPARGGMFCDLDDPSLGAGYEPCIADEDCNSLLCWMGTCRDACANANDCGANGYCASIEVVSEPGVRTVTGGSARVQACQQFPVTITDPGALYGRGQSCTSNEQCRSQLCLEGVCSDFCCTSRECTGGRCAPTRFGSSWVMACVR